MCDADDDSVAEEAVYENNIFSNMVIETRIAPHQCQWSSSILKFA